MFKIKEKAEFIRDIRLLDDSVKNIRLSEIEIDKNNYDIKYIFICDQTVSEEVKNKVLKEVEMVSPKVFRGIEIVIKKIVSNDSLINHEIIQYLTRNYPSVSIFLKETDVMSVVYGNVVKYTLRLSKDGCEYVEKNGALNKLSEYLATKFCSDFVGSVDAKEIEESVNLLEDEVYIGELKKIEHRTIKVSDVTIIDDAYMGDVAIYLEDVIDGKYTVCGKVTEISEKQTKNGKPFFVIRIDDTTSTLNGVYFTKKTTYLKIKEIQVGDCIIARGTMGEYNGKRSFTFDKINLCTFPSDFVKKDRFKKTAPKEYSLIFPEPAVTVKVESVFDREEVLPQELIDTTYVVFDLETTGTDLLANSITEVGAVKIINGQIKEKFGTLIHPNDPIVPKITELTGITNEMVKNSPRIEAVLPDFIKFIEGAVLIAHNADFDIKFIKKFARAEEYEINNKVIDTMVMARELLPDLKNAKLDTLCEHFNITFHHHRAVDDAFATAESFINLMKIKYKKQ